MTDPTNEALTGAATEAGESGHTNEYLLSDPGPGRAALAAAKLCDALSTGFEPEFSPHEAEAAGAFIEDALREDDAGETNPALPRFLAGLLSPKADS
jgi:hypothetical protein